MHSNMPINDQGVMHSLKIFIGSYFPSLILPPVDHSKVWPFMDTFYYLLQETGYVHLQATKPDTVGRGPGQKEVMDIITIMRYEAKSVFWMFILDRFPFLSLIGLKTRYKMKNYKFCIGCLSFKVKMPKFGPQFDQYFLLWW